MSLNLKPSTLYSQRILGIDPGSALCGWAVIETDGHDQKLVESGCVKTTSRDTTAERLKIIHNELSAIINKHQPTEGAVEELFFVKNIKTGIAVGQARGVILLTLAQSDIVITEYKPTTIKQALTGYGHASKQQVQQMVKCTLKAGEIIAQDDENDAVAVALCHCQHSRWHANPISGYAKVAKAPREISTPNTRENTKMARERGISGCEGAGKLVYPELSYRIVGALYDTFNQLGPGLQEKYYQSLLRQKLREKDINVKEQVKVEIEGLPIRLGRYYLDFVADDKVAIELKAGVRFKEQDINQIMSYLRQSGLQLGILARFGKEGVVIKRLLRGKTSHRHWSVN